MKDSRYIMMLAVAAAAGAAIGMLTDRKQPAKGGLLGAAAGIVAGSAAAGAYEYVTRERVPFYSNSSPLYEEIETI